MDIIEQLRNKAANSDYVVRSLTVVQDEMFYASDLFVEAKVVIDRHPSEPLDDGSYRTELFRMFSPCSSPVCYRRTSWKYFDGKPVQELSALGAVLDLELRAFLMNRFNAELYDLNTLNLPKATTVTSWWRRILGKL